MTIHLSPGRLAALSLAALASLALGAPGLARAEDPKPAAAPPAGPPAAPVADTGAQTFATPEEAAKAAIDAIDKNDDAALKVLLGRGSEDIIQSGGDPKVAEQRKKFADAAKTKLNLAKKSDDVVILEVGDDAWPSPIPLVQKDGKWSFDAEGAREEILKRRIGAHELEAIGWCLAYLEAQAAYASKDRDGDGVREFAQRLVSSSGRHDGLYWKADTTKGEEGSPLADALAPVKDLITARSKGAPLSGYYWRILSSQGPNAPGGAYSYLINGNMIAGCALVGVPADYRNTGVMTFLVSNNGKIMQKDLGEKSAAIVEGMTSFDPDPTWKEVSQEDLVASAAAN